LSKKWRKTKQRPSSILARLKISSLSAFYWMHKRCSKLIIYFISPNYSRVEIVFNLSFSCLFKKHLFIRERPLCPILLTTLAFLSDFQGHSRLWRLRGYSNSAQIEIYWTIKKENSRKDRKQVTIVLFRITCF